MYNANECATGRIYSSNPLMYNVNECVPGRSSNPPMYNVNERAAVMAHKYTRKKLARRGRKESD